MNMSHLHMYCTRVFQQNVVLANVVYYDEVIWSAKLRWDSTTMKITEEKSDKLFPVASVTKVITVSVNQLGK